MSPSISINVDCEKQTHEANSPGAETLVDSVNQDVESQQSSKDRKHWISRMLSKSTDRTETTEAEPTPVDHYQVVTRFLERRPKGYPQVATFQSSDPNFMQYRGFGYLHCRVLSDLQYGIGCLEMELDEIDQFEMENQKRKLTSRRRDSQKSADELAKDGYPSHIRRCRSDILLELRTKLLEYDEFALKTRDMMSLQRPSNRDYESVRTWYRDNEPLVRGDAQFIRRKEDMISLRSGRESAGFEGFVEGCLNQVDDFLLRRFKSDLIRRIFLTPELREKTDSEFVRYYAPNRVNKLVNLIITGVIFVLLVLPVAIMYRVTQMGSRQSPLDAIGVLIVFTLVFGMAVSSLTTAKRHELFGASAAYAAVLVVFIGNFGVQQVEVLQ